MEYSKGRPPPPKKCFLSGIARITSPPHPISGNVKNDVLRVWQKNTNYDNDGCNDNYDGNVDDNDDKNDQINMQICFGFWVKIYQI